MSATNCMKSSTDHKKSPTDVSATDHKKSPTDASASDHKKSPADVSATNRMKTSAKEFSGSNHIQCCETFKGTLVHSQQQNKMVQNALALAFQKK